MISIITPWLDHPELIGDYEATVQGAEVIVIDNASASDTAQALVEMVHRLGGLYIRNEINHWYSSACNQGLAAAHGDVVMCLNNDIIATQRGWLKQAERDVRDGVLAGPSLAVRVIAGQPMCYLEGWCVAARRAVWDALGRWDAETYPLPYWEDVDLSWRAGRLGFTLYRANWPLVHLNNTTSRTTPGAYDASERNRQTFEARVRLAQEMAALERAGDESSIHSA